MRDDVQLVADDMITHLVEEGGSVITSRVEAETFSGQSRFVNSIGEEHELFFPVERGTVAFDETGELTMIEAHHGEITTCNCCDVSLQRQPYTLSANRLLLYTERLLVAFGLSARVAGVSAFWLPFYVRPLEETLESPLWKRARLGSTGVLHARSLLEDSGPCDLVGQHIHPRRKPVRLRSDGGRAPVPLATRERSTHQRTPVRRRRLPQNLVADPLRLGRRTARRLETRPRREHAQRLHLRLVRR